MLIGFRANKGLPMQLLLYGDLSPNYLIPLPIWARTYHCRGAKCRAPINKCLGCASSYLRSPRRPRPKKIDWNPDQNYLQAFSRGLRLVEQEHKHDRDRRQYIERRNKRVAKGTIRPLGIRPFCSQHKNPYYRQYVEEERGEHNVIEQIAVKVAVSYLAGRIHVLRAQQN